MSAFPVFATALFALALPDGLQEQAPAPVGLERSFEDDLQVRLDRMELVLDGVRVDGAPAGIAGKCRRAVQFIDSPVPGAASGSFERTFTRLRGRLEIPSATDSEAPPLAVADLSSALEGRAVSFERDRNGAFRVFLTGMRSGEDREGVPRSVLNGLSPEWGLSDLLPSEHVEQGSSWRTLTESLRTLLLPGGATGLEPKLSATVPHLESLLLLRLAAYPERLDDFRGRCDVTYAGTRVEEGRTLEVLELEVDLRTSRDSIAALRDLAAEPAPDTAATTLSRALSRFDYIQVESRFRGKGELVWDGHDREVHRVVLTGEERIVITAGGRREREGEVVETSFEAYLSGERTITLSSRALAPSSSR